MLFQNDSEFSFTGTHESVELAKFMIEVNVKHFQDMASIRESIDEYERKLNGNGTRFVNKNLQRNGNGNGRR